MERRQGRCAFHAFPVLQHTEEAAARHRVHHHKAHNECGGSPHLLYAARHRAHLRRGVRHSARLRLQQVYRAVVQRVVLQSAAGGGDNHRLRQLLPRTHQERTLPRHRLTVHALHRDDAYQQHRAHVQRHLAGEEAAQRIPHHHRLHVNASACADSDSYHVGYKHLLRHYLQGD